MRLVSFRVLLLLAFLTGLVWAVPASPAPDPDASLRADRPDWYKDGVFYHVWLHAFADSDGNGVGDLPGVTSKLGYLEDLGVTALWLSPFWQSPSTHGYDVTDYSRVDPRYGTNQDLKDLLKAAHARGMRVIFDYVPNHVSARHPWFTGSRDGQDGLGNWFLWRDQPPVQGWRDFGGRSAWRSSGGRSYYALFWDQMPDLNYREPAVRKAMADVVSAWLDFGFDGIRVDAVKYLFEDEVTGANADQPETLEYFRTLRREIIDPYAALGYPKFLVAENWTDDLDNLNAYLSSDGRTNDGFHATLDFPFGTRVTRILNGSGTVESDLGLEYDALIRRAEAEGAWTFTFLSNHDNYQSRPATLYRSAAKVRAAQTLQMTGWGTPVLYYGNEAGMTGSNGNDQNMRRPFPWNQVAALRADPDSPWNWQALLDRLRRDHPALRRGDLRFLTAEPDAAAVYQRTLGDERILVVLNPGEDPLGDFTLDLGADAAGGISTLVGDPGASSLTGTVLRVGNLGPFGIRIFQLGVTGGTPLRGDFASSW